MPDMEEQMMMSEPEMMGEEKMMGLDDEMMAETAPSMSDSGRDAMAAE
jgi:hypothetical protein